MRLLKKVVANSNELFSLKNQRKSSVVTVVGAEYTGNGTVYIPLDPDMEYVSELKIKVISNGFSDIAIDGVSTGISGGSGVSPSSAANSFFNLLPTIAGNSSLRSNFFNGGVHSLSFSGAGEVKVLLYAKYSSRNR